MKNKYGIGFFVISIIAFLVISGAYELSYQKAKERSQANAQANASEQEEELYTDLNTVVEAQGEALKEDCYYLMEVNGYIVVYLSDKKTPYEYTDIPFDELPQKIRDEVRNGKYIKDSKTLYGFLENYSS
jgi:hypothetical protein